MNHILRGDGSNPNPLIGIVLLIVLIVFVLPDRLPQFLSDLSPYLFSGLPCGRLPAARDLAAHQSVIGRSARDPLRLELAASPIAGDGSLQLRLTVQNLSLGTVPILFREDDIAVSASEPTSDGFAVIVKPAGSAPAPDLQADDAGGFAESDIRLLGPRQRCAHSLPLIASSAIISGGGVAEAVYRMSSAGQPQPQSDGISQIYGDQGLDLLTDGIARSPLVEIKPRAASGESGE